MKLWLRDANHHFSKAISALVKRYFDEPGRREILGLLRTRETVSDQ